jgi:hypothetical protein
LPCQAQALTSTQEAQLQEAERINRLVVQYYHEGSYQEALPLPEEVYALRQ